MTQDNNIGIGTPDDNFLFEWAYMDTFSERQLVNMAHQCDALTELN